MDYIRFIVDMFFMDKSAKSSVKKDYMRVRRRLLCTKLWG